jgi:hypothetical protein
MIQTFRDRTLEAVMNSIRNGLGMRETEIARKPSRPWDPHFYAIFAQVHNTLLVKWSRPRSTERRRSDEEDGTNATASFGRDRRRTSDEQIEKRQSAVTTEAKMSESEGHHGKPSLVRGRRAYGGSDGLLPPAPRNLRGGDRKADPQTLPARGSDPRAPQAPFGVANFPIVRAGIRKSTRREER